MQATHRDPTSLGGHDKHNRGSNISDSSLNHLCPVLRVLLLIGRLAKPFAKMPTRRRVPMCCSPILWALNEETSEMRSGEHFQPGPLVFCGLGLSFQGEAPNGVVPLSFLLTPKEGSLNNLRMLRFKMPGAGPWSNGPLSGQIPLLFEKMSTNPTFSGAGH